VDYEARGVDARRQQRLAVLGDLILAASFNVTSVRDPEEIERTHFLDSLSLLDVPGLMAARRLADVGSGAGLPALVLALALPDVNVVAVESVRKKCSFIEDAAKTLGLTNLAVACARAEEYGRSDARAAHDVVVTRAVGSLAVVAEYSLPLLTLDGAMVAMKGLVSDQERIQGLRALAILGADGLDALRLHPFEGAENRWAYVAKKVRPTPAEFPRRPGLPAKRPLGDFPGADGA
jgi:16S rRNA (guanine527-N7)-methyltransferase